MELREDELAHYGVQGMKWGVRKDGKPQGFQYGEAGRKSHKQSRKQKRAIKKAKKNAEKMRKLRKQALESNDPKKIAKGMHLLSDEELQQKVNRIKQEHEVDKIIAANKVNRAKVTATYADALNKTLSIPANATRAGDAFVDTARALSLVAETPERAAQIKKAKAELSAAEARAAEAHAKADKAKAEARKAGLSEQVKAASNQGAQVKKSTDEVNAITEELRKKRTGK